MGHHDPVKRPLYVETLVRGDLDQLWHATQDPAAHTRWDLRFSEIVDVTPQRAGQARTFRYTLRLPGRTVAGTGTSVGERRRPDGTLTSALRFASPDPLSLIRRGSGWWRYVPTEVGTRFLTGYDYEPGWGRLGRTIDRLGFRRLIGWATAWSFDRLRLWVEDGISPESAARRGVFDAALRASAVAAGALTLARGPRWAAPVALLALLPALPGAPRARRCLRRPHDDRGRAAPDTLRALPEPA